MSSDPFADLASSLLRYCDALEDTLQHGWSNDSTAWIEARDRTLAGNWGSQPSRDALLFIRLLTVAAFDHLRALATLIPAPRIVYALSATTRGAIEASAQAHFLADPLIDTRERVRRHINGRLVSLHENRRLVGSFTDPSGVIDIEMERIAQRIENILNAARSHRFTVHKGDKYRPPYVGEKPPGTLQMAEESVSGGTTGLGSVYWQSLSAVAHSQAQGIVSHAQPIQSLADEATGDQLAAIGLSAKDLSLRHLGAVLSTVSMFERIVTLFGLDATPTSAPIIQTLTAWGRIAEVPYPGPRLGKA
jgi:hypothetical protein